MKIDICDLQDETKIDRRLIRNYTKKILQILDENSVEVSICFTDDGWIQKLNNTYRHVDMPTDVLAFPMRGCEGLPKETNILGDVVISLQTAKNQAKKRNKDLNSEILLYLVHGILHLLGYNDSTAKERLRMRRKQKEILRKITKN